MTGATAFPRYLTFAIVVATIGQLVFGTVSDFQQFEGKAFATRLLAYPALMLALPLAYAMHRRLARTLRPLPWLAFAALATPFLIDVTGNTFDMYDQIDWWDDLNHFVNWFLLGLGIGLLLTRVKISPKWVLGALVTGAGAVLAIAWELAEWYAFIRHGTERGSAYEDTLGDELLGTFGAAVAAAALLLLRRARIGGARSSI